MLPASGVNRATCEREFARRVDRAFSLTIPPLELTVTHGNELKIYISAFISTQAINDRP